MSYESMIRLLGAIPATGQHSTASITERVNSTGKHLTKRSVERALAKLADQPGAPLRRSGDASSGHFWSWNHRHPLMTRAHRETTLIQSLLLHRMAEHLLPPTLRAQLAEEERLARSEMACNSDSNMAWWVAHVIALPPGPQRFPQPIEAGVFEAISQALWTHRQLQIEYRNRTDDNWRTLTLHPQGLVQDGYLLYLVATINDYLDLRQLALLRMRNVAVLQANSRTLDSLDFHKHVVTQFDWPYGEPQELLFWIHADRKIELEELPVGKDQRIDLDPDDQGYHRVRVTVAASHRLDAYLAGFGEAVRYKSSI